MIPREQRDSIIKNAEDHKGITVELAMNCNELEDYKKLADLQLHVTGQKAQEYIRKHKIEGKLGEYLIDIVVDDAIKVRADYERYKLSADKDVEDARNFAAEMQTQLKAVTAERDRLRKELEEWKSASLAWESEYHKDTEALREKADAAIARAETAEQDSVADHMALTGTIDDLKTRLDSAIKERDHWRANHDNQVAIKKAILDRPDLQDRAKKVQKMYDKIEQGKALLRECILNGEAARTPYIVTRIEEYLK